MNRSALDLEESALSASFKPYRKLVSGVVACSRSFKKKILLKLIFLSNCTNDYNCSVPCPLRSTDYPDNWYGQRGIDVLQQRLTQPFSTRRPWFLQMNFPGPHNPYFVTTDMLQRNSQRAKLFTEVARIKFHPSPQNFGGGQLYFI